MVFLSKPADQRRLNATVHELIGLQFDGLVFVRGQWDPFDTLEYLERRRDISLIPTISSDGHLFRLCDKFIAFTDECVIISSCLNDVLVQIGQND